MDEKIKNKLEKIKMLAMDIDGTLTDGGMYYSAQGDTMKKFYVRDGMGIDMLNKAGILTAFITSEQSEIVIARAKKLKISKVILGSWTKDTDLRKIAEEFGLTLDEVAFIGDDVNDIPAFKVAGFRACPSDASPLVHPFVDFISTKQGGHGAIREIAEMILIAKNISLFQ
jgi:YrbI family 3-deoxy-D-manno-octulosonate 8-phosphate phosphatase